MRAGQVRIDGQGALVGIARGLDVARLELDRAEHEQQLRLLRREFVGAPDQLGAFGQVAAQAAHGAEATQGFAAVGIGGQFLAIALFGLLETALAMVFDGFSEHVLLGLGAGCGARKTPIMPHGAVLGFRAVLKRSLRLAAGGTRKR